jgi:hypothetical protein
MMICPHWFRCRTIRRRMCIHSKLHERLNWCDHTMTNPLRHRREDPQCFGTIEKTEVCIEMEEKHEEGKDEQGNEEGVR